MSDFLMCNQLLVAHLCHLMPCFGLWLGKGWQMCSCAAITQAKVMVLIQPWHQLLLNYVMTSIWIQ
jgi:hypothetical protein